ncbi:MAG: molecular chaperone HtpG [Deltaproteobacteria bacterium]|nr:molecular chaperone HtpG [Deltaproteobacteria bacterium]MBU53756.1 molecular chaperone HtpG [Deltaproteobacteria bacterium]
MSEAKERFEFQAETTQLLHLMIHSLYTNKEIFLRELISNASDALDKLRFEALTDSSVLDGGKELEIRLDTDKDKRTITISDNGIGMSREEVIKNIGTIAQSGTKELIKQLKESEKKEESLELIGQFGVGFYSCLMVADQVTLITRRVGEENATRFDTDGEGAYTIEDATRDGHGTTIILHLKEVDDENGIEDFTSEYVLRRIVKRYSDFINYPIILKVEKVEYEQDEEGNFVEDGEKTVTIEDETLNSMKPIWTRAKSDVTDEEYNEFYKHVASDWEDPLVTLPLKVEGRLEYQSLLFIPSKAPHDLYHPSARMGLQLYVRRVLIMERCEDLLPSYLRFVKGVVDSSDLPLNVSRELLQQDRVLAQMKKYLTKKVLDHLKYLSNEETETYDKFYKAFGRVLKEGAAEDFGNREKLLNLLRFESSNDAEAMTSLADYIERMKEGQEEIYFLTGESRKVIENSPHLEAFKKKEIEVLYLVDPVDEILMDSVQEFDGKKFKSVGKGVVDLGSEEEKEQAEKERKEKEAELSGLLEKIQKHLDDHVKEVRLSSRLTDSPVCLVGNEFDYSPRLERLLRNSGGSQPRQKRILEINPEHEMLGKMKERFEKDQEDGMIDTWADVMLGYALLAEGSTLPDPAQFNRQVADIMLQVL